VVLTRGMLSKNAAATAGKGEGLLHLGRARNQKKGAISEFSIKGYPPTPLISGLLCVERAHTWSCADSPVHRLDSARERL
jgi:hypothetical protein